VLFQKSISWVLNFVGVIFVVMNHVHLVLFIPQLWVGYNEFYNQYKEIWEASYGEKRKIFDPLL